MRLKDFIGQPITPDMFPPIEGDLMGWQAVANMCFAAGCEAQSVLILASFAAPLMSLLPSKEGGAVVAIHGGKRSGKDLAQLAAETVWGPEGCLQRDPETMGNLPVLLPGLVHRDPLSVRKRLAGLLLEDKAVTWRTLFLTVNPMPLYKAAFKDLPAPGIEYTVKVPPLLIDGRDDKVLRHKLASNRAVAGYLYLSYLTRPDVHAWCKRAMVSKVGEIVDKAGVPSERRFEARAIAAISIAAAVVQKAAIIDVEPERIERWMLEQTFPMEKAA